MITGFHGTHVTIGVIFLLIVALKVRRGDRGAAGLPDRPEGQLRDRRNPGLYWHFVDLVWVFIFAFFYLVVNGRGKRDIMDHAEGQQHPIGTYLKVWGLLFVLSTCHTWWTISKFTDTCAGS